MYDWANSVYSLVITSSLFPVYFGLVAQMPDGSRIIPFFGYPILNTALFSYAVSFSFLLTGLASPWITALADLGNHRKPFLQWFCALGAVSCAALSLFTGPNIETGILLFVAAAVGYSGSLVFYNSFLPTITTPNQYATVSARGFAMGYIGSVILLVIILLPILLPTAFAWLNLDFKAICRVGFILTGLWWLVFGLRSIAALPVGKSGPRHPISPRQVWGRMQKALQVIRNVRGLSRFLVGFFWINTGVQTIMYLAALFGDQELHLASEKLILTILILQVVAIAGARVFALLSVKNGDLTILIIAGLLWVVVCFSAYFVQTELQFYGLAALVGLVMGGTQALLRSAFSTFLPDAETEKSALFGFYDLLEKLSTVLGTLVYGLVNQLSGSMRLSALVLSLFFLLGIVGLRSARSQLKNLPARFFS